MSTLAMRSEDDYVGNNLLLSTRNNNGVSHTSSTEEMKACQHEVSAAPGI